MEQLQSTNKIHPQAVVAKSVKIGVGNEIGPYAVIEEGVEIGSYNRIGAHAYLCRGTVLGDHNQIHMGAIIGHEPQDVAYQGDLTFTKIGSHNIIREYVTIHRGTKPGSATLIGDRNFLMAYTHVAHNCHIHNNVIMVNQASLTGYVEVEDNAFLSGMTGFHQFTRIGKLAMVSALTVCNKDVPPYMIVGGRPGVAIGINVVGLRRAGIPPEIRQEIKQAYKLIYRSGLNLRHALERLRTEFSSPEIAHLVKFIESSKRGIVAGSKQKETGLSSEAI